MGNFETPEQIADRIMPKESTTVYYRYDDENPDNDPITVRVGELRGWLLEAARFGRDTHPSLFIPESD